MMRHACSITCRPKRSANCPKAGMKAQAVILKAFAIQLSCERSSGEFHNQFWGRTEDTALTKVGRDEGKSGSNDCGIQGFQDTREEEPDDNLPSVAPRRFLLFW